MSSSSWQFQYWNGSSWVNFANAQVDHIMEELSSLSGGGNAAGQEECVFDIPNTAANRTIVQALPFAQCLYNGTLIFPLANQCAVVGGLKYSPTTIEVTLYNYVFVQLEQATQTVTKAYTNTAVSTIASYICGLAGVSVGTVPSLNVSITFNNANCFKAMQDLATACGLDYWGDGNGFNIGTRNSTQQTLGWCSSNSKRGLDYTKAVDSVIVKGVNGSGAAIQGAAYSSGYSSSNPGSVATFTVKKVSDINTLNNVASLKLQKLNNPSNGNSLECVISQVATWHPGQYVSASRPDLALVGSYIIQRITKQAVLCTVEVDAAMPQMDIDALQQDSDANDLATYTTQPQTQIPVNVVLQGLLDLYHLTEGSGTTANDSTPNTPSCPGTITFGTGGGWVTNSAFPGELFLNLAAGGYVDCPNAGNTIGSGNCSAFSIGGWFSPSAITSLGNLIGKANCYILELYGTQGAIRFGVYIGGAWQYITSPNGVASVGGRCFAMGVYDGTSMYLYVSDPSGVIQLLVNPATGNSYFSQAQTGAVGSSTSDTYLGGSNYAGVIAECMIWSRALQPSEVQALFFQPLTQVVLTSASDWYLAVSNSTGGTVSPTGVITVPAGQSQQVTATASGGYAFTGWTLDGVSQGTANPITVPAQTVGSTHTLVAQFAMNTGLPPSYSGVMVIRPDQGFAPETLLETGKCIQGSTAQEALTEAGSCINGALAQETLAETGKVNPTGQPQASESLSETASASTPTASVFGDSTAEATAKALSSGTVQLCRFQATASSTYGTFKIRIYGYGSSCSVQVGIYADNSGAPGSLLALGTPVTAPTSAAWFDVYCEGGPIVNGNYYWFGPLPNATLNIYYKTGSTNQAATVSATYPNMPSSISSPTYAAQQYSFLCYFD